MIISSIMGGLGNQMFQYAMGRSLALRTGQDLRLDLDQVSGDKLRIFALDQFKIAATVATPDELPPRPRRGLMGKVRRMLRLTGPMPRIHEAGLPFDPVIYNLQGPAHLAGYWQTERYFTTVADQIRADFALARPMSPARTEILRQIHAGNAVSLHVRRGDYVENAKVQEVHGSCEPEWYAAAMARIEARMENVTYFIFSDDPAWARENIPSSRPRVIVEPQDDGRDGEDIHLMAACRSHIIANSSFSWWGAWLDPNADKHVIAPAHWFRDASKDYRDVVPLTWEKF